MFDQTLDSPGPGTNSPDITNIDHQPGSPVLENNSPDTPSFETQFASPDLSDIPKLLTQYTDGKNPATAYANAVKEATFALQLVHKASRNLAQDHASFLAFQKTQHDTSTKEHLGSSRKVFTQKLYLLQIAELHDSLAHLIELDRAISGLTGLRARLVFAQAKTFVHSHGLKGAFALLVNTLYLVESSRRRDLILRGATNVIMQMVLVFLCRLTCCYLIGELGAVWGWTFVCVLLGLIAYLF